MTGMSVGCKLTDRLTDIFIDLRVVALIVMLTACSLAYY